MPSSISERASPQRAGGRWAFSVRTSRLGNTSRPHITRSPLRVRPESAAPWRAMWLTRSDVYTLQRGIVTIYKGVGCEPSGKADCPRKDVPPRSRRLDCEGRIGLGGHVD